MEFRDLQDPAPGIDPVESDPSKKNVPVFSNSLALKLAAGLLTLALLVLTVSFYSIWFSGKPFLEGVSKNQQNEIGRSVVLALSDYLSDIEGISRSLAEFAAYSIKTEENFRAVIPRFLDSLGRDSMIAGGGVWPEPGWFELDRDRASFFWGRQKNGALKYYDDYNRQNAPAYQTEEWYVPARHLTSPSLYWSKSYTDPYSLQPMVTCTSPIYSKGRFVGVATVDLILEKVSSILQRLVDANKAYAIVVDRNGKLISFPDPNKILINRSSGLQGASDYMYFDELAEAEPGFASIANYLRELSSAEYSVYAASSQYYHELVNMLADNSPRIDENEAKRIAANIWASKTYTAYYPEAIKYFDLERDPIFNEPVSVVVYAMPKTHWKVITVFRQSAYLSSAKAISYQLLFYFGVLVVMVGLAAYFFLRHVVLKPIVEMTEQLSVGASEKNTTSSPIAITRRDEIGQLAFWFNVKTEQLERARDMADTANQAKTAFIAKISHELRTPLNSVIGFSKRLQINLEGEIDERSYGALCKIHSNGKALLDVINDILDMSSLEYGDVSLNLEAHRVNGMIGTVQHACEPLAKNKGLTLNCNLLAGDEFVVCDREKFIQALRNLVSNAVKFTKTGGVVVDASLSHERGIGYLKIDVTDTGDGINPANMDRLFKKFSQLSSRIGESTGTGVGLYIVKRIVDLHNGKVEVCSALGKGSTFTVIIPQEPLIRR